MVLLRPHLVHFSFISSSSRYPWYNRWWECFVRYPDTYHHGHIPSRTLTFRGHLPSRTLTITDTYHRRTLTIDGHLPSRTLTITDTYHHGHLPSRTLTITDTYHHGYLPSPILNLNILITKPQFNK